MPGSLSNTKAVLANIHADQIAVLITILRQNTLRQRRFVESVFNERARYFCETLQFLKDIGCVREDGNELELVVRNLLVHPQNEERRIMVEIIADSPGRYQAILADYLAQYHVDKGRILHRPSSHSRLEQSAIRNFLMELHMVSFSEEEDCYCLDGELAHLYLWAKNVRGAESKTELLRRANRRDELGAAAEIAVLEFEHEHVGPDWSGQVEHVSMKNPGASFDIKSLRVVGDRPVPRFIEVKAVPADSFQFFWTAAEIEAALLLRRTYFLYLLPALGGGKFDLSKMEMIEDPYCTVYQNSIAWTKDDKIIVCRRRPET